MSSAQATMPARPRPAGRMARALTPGRSTRRRLIALLAAGALFAAGYGLWLRDSGLVAIRTVDVTGLSGNDSGRIRAALEAEARNMTTLHVDRTRLARAVSAFPVVRAVEARPDFPHGIRVHVVQHRQAGLLVARSGRVAVAGDGTILTGLPAKKGLPVIRISGAIPARRVASGSQLAAAKVAGTLPAALRARVKEIGREPGRGVVVPLQGGPKLIFGDGSRAAAKWAAAAAVLADRTSAQAEYIDVRIPERPAAGGLRVETVAPAAPAGSPPAPPAAPGPTAAPTAGQPEAAPPAGPASPVGAGVGGAPPVRQQSPAPPPAAGGGAAAPNPQP